MHKSTIASEEASVAARRAFQIDEQARITIARRESAWEYRMTGHPLAVTYQFTNIGKTEGEVLGVDRHVSLIPFRTDVQNVTFPPMRPEAHVAGGIISTGEVKLFTAFDYSLSNAQQSVEQGKALIASWGCIEYRDIFGDLHWTDFCDVSTRAHGRLRILLLPLRARRKYKIAVHLSRSANYIVALPRDGTGSATQRSPGHKRRPGPPNPAPSRRGADLGFKTLLPRPDGVPIST
jgi:hypothetical protein